LLGDIIGQSSKSTAEQSADLVASESDDELEQELKDMMDTKKALLAKKKKVKETKSSGEMG
jgi:hypothetical protein